MGYDYSVIDADGDAHLRLGLSESSVVYTALDGAGLFDQEFGPPPMPAEIWARYEREPDEGAGPIEWELSGPELEYFGFGSPDPEKVPIWKLADSDPWVITPREARVLADGIARILDGDRPTAPSAEVSEMLAEIGIDPEKRARALRGLLDDFAEFCRAASQQGGFWSY